MLDDISIRLANPHDAPALARLAVLDEQRRPEGEVLLAESGGRVVAALPVGGGTPVADPFEQSAQAVDLLTLRARQLEAPARGRRSRLLPRQALALLLHP
jgi:hypothetical protein